MLCRQAGREGCLFLWGAVRGNLWTGSGIKRGGGSPLWLRSGARYNEAPLLVFLPEVVGERRDTWPPEDQGGAQESQPWYLRARWRRTQMETKGEGRVASPSKRQGCRRQGRAWAQYLIQCRWCRWAGARRVVRRLGRSRSGARAAGPPRTAPGPRGASATGKGQRLRWGRGRSAAGPGPCRHRWWAKTR